MGRNGPQNGPQNGLGMPGMPGMVKVCQCLGPAFFFPSHEPRQPRYLSEGGADLEKYH